MSQTTLATVSIDLIANNAAFLSGLSKTEASLKNSVKSMGSTISNFGSALSQTLGSVGGSIGTELSGVFTGIGSAVSDMASKISAAKGVTGALSIAVGGLAAVGVAAAASLAGLALSGAEMAESLSLTSQKTGISIRDLQTLQAAGSTVGLSLDSITTATRKFSQALTGSGKGGSQLDGVLGRLGVTSHDSNEALLQVADAFSKMQDGPVKASLAVELFGRAGLDMIPLLNKGRDGLKQFSDIVTDFGPNVDKNAVASMERWKTSTTELSQSWDSFKVSLSGGVGILAHMVDGIAKVTKGFGDMAGALLKNPLASLGALANGGLGGLFASAEAGRAGASNPAQDAAQHAALAAQDALIARKQELFQIEAAGGAAEYALAQKKQKLAEDTASFDWDGALAIQQELPALQEAADKEKQRNAAAKALVAEHERLLDLITKQSGGKIHVSNPTRPFPVVAAPNIQTTAQQFNDIGESLKDLGNAAGVTSAVLQQGKDAVADFYSTWDRDNKKTVDVINQKFDDQLKNFQGLMTLQAISQEQFNEVSKDLENQRLAEIQKAQAEQGTNFAASFGQVFSQIVNDGDAMAKHLSDSIGGAIKDLTSEVTKFAVTGKANFASVGKSLESSVVQSGLNKLTSSAVKGIGGILGVHFPGAKADGSSQNPFYVRNADHSIGDKTSGGGGAGQSLGDIGSKLGGSLKGIFSGLGGIFSKFGGSGIGSLFNKFGGFLAEGGDVTPGRSYIVGEKQPELFVPRAAGTIVPSVHGGSGGSGGRPIQVNAHFHGVTDVDTFKSSKNQILNHLASQVSRAVSRR